MAKHTATVAAITKMFDELLNQGVYPCPYKLGGTEVEVSDIDGSAIPITDREGHVVAIGTRTTKVTVTITER